MEELINQIRKSLDANLYYLALFSSLAIPDMCGAIESANGRATVEKYKKWYEKYVYPRYQTITAEECYEYRCTALHQGKSSPNKQNANYDRILFIEPSPSKKMNINVKRINTPNESAIMIDLEEFCLAIIDGVDIWLNQKKGTPQFEKNIKNFMHRYPNGLGQYTKGISTIS